MASKTELQYRLRNKIIDGLATIIGTSVKWGSLAFIAYCFRDATMALAGKTTMAQIGLDVLGNLKISEGLEIVVTATAVIYGVKERRLRHQKVEYLAERLKKYETQHDPGRSSSKLTPKGTTRPEDEEQ